MAAADGYSLLQMAAAYGCCIWLLGTTTVAIQSGPEIYACKNEAEVCGGRALIFPATLNTRILGRFDAVLCVRVGVSLAE